MKRIFNGRQVNVEIHNQTMYWQSAMNTQVLLLADTDMSQIFFSVFEVLDMLYREYSINLTSTYITNYMLDIVDYEALDDRS